jgi:hypothetical protein
MYTSIHVKNFRGLEDLRVEDLRRINLIVGKNNTGKTSLLEAVFLLGEATTPTATLDIGRLRGQRFSAEKPDPDPIWRAMFRGMDPGHRIEITGQRVGDVRARELVVETFQPGFYDPADQEEPRVETGEAVKAIRFRYQPPTGKPTETTALLNAQQLVYDTSDVELLPDVVPTRLLSARSLSSVGSDIKGYGSLVRTKQERPVIEALRLIDPRLERIETVADSSGLAVYADLGMPSLVPLVVCGEGMVRLFSIVVGLTMSKGGALLVDEIDNGLHHSVMVPFWGAILKLATELDVQVFATTHNDEIIRSAISAFTADLSVLRLYRLDRRDNGVAATAYNEAMLAAVNEVGFEVRG